MQFRQIILERARMLADFPSHQLPDFTESLQATVDTIASGTIFFYGATPVEVGLSCIDWSGSHIKHQEWPAQLNRLGYLAPLASAYAATKNEKYAEAAKSYIEDWISGWSYADKQQERRPGDSTLNISIRLGSSVHSGWGGTLSRFLHSPAFDDAFLSRMLDSIAAQAEFLARNLTAINNWRISELDALVFTAARFSFLHCAGKILETGITGMRNALAAQFLPDGVHSERTPSYHSWMAQVALNYYMLAQLFPEIDARVHPDTLRRSLEYVVQSRLFGVNDATAPFKDADVPKERFERNRMLAAAGIRIDPPSAQVFPAAGQVFVRSGFDPGAEYLAFDAGTWGGAHCHLSRLAFTYRAGGRMLIADPGILNYEMSDPLASYGKGTSAHTTLNIDGMNQSDTDAFLHRTALDGDVALIHASYQGGYWEGRFYWGFRDGRGRGVFGWHDRILLLVKGEYLLVLDNMLAEAGHEIRNCFQVGPMEKWACDEENLAWRSENPDVNVLVKLLLPAGGVKMTCLEGSREPLAGWVGRRGNEAIPAPRLEFAYPADERRPGMVSAVIIAAFSGAPPAYETPDTGVSADGYTHWLAVRTPSGHTDALAWTKNLALPLDNGPFLSDAGLVWLRKDASGKAVKCFIVDGSYVRDGSASIWSGERTTGLLPKL